MSSGTVPRCSVQPAPHLYLSMSNRRPLRFDTAIDDRLLRPSEKGGVLTYRVEVSSVLDKSWFAGLYPEREVDARSGLSLGVSYR